MFTLDAFMASVLLVAALVFMAQINVQKPNTENMEFIGQDILETLSVIQVYQVKDTVPFVQAEIANGNITDLNKSVLVQIGEFWAKNLPGNKDQKLAKALLEEHIPSGYGFNLSMGGETIYNVSKQDFVASVNTRRMISGIEKGKPISGSTSDAFLKSIRDKPSSVYLYFGGFVGQGNLTGTLFVPAVENITAIVMELAVDKNFTLAINGITCDEPGGKPSFAPSLPTPQNMTADVWDISHCNGSIPSTGGFSNFTFSFGSVNGAYIGGGFIKVSYRTDQFQELDYGTNTSRSYLPGINGIVNLFDSFYVPGILNNLTMRLHYLANHTTTNNTFYVTIGNTTVYQDSDSTDVIDIVLDDANFTALNYSMFNSTTVPLRVGFENLTFQRVYTGTGDVMIVTDVSGSMDYPMGSAATSYDRNCDSSQLFDSDTKRLSVAKCLDKSFAQDILNVTGNKVGLVSYSWATINSDTVSLTTNDSLLNSTIDGYTPLSSTCICCGIISAVTELVPGVMVTPYILRNSQWWFTNESLHINDLQDVQGDYWWQTNFTMNASWRQGGAILGHDETGSGEPVTTELGVTGSSQEVFVDLWEYAADAPYPIDFSSGVLNATANTWGLVGANDGWDSTSGVYDADGFAVTIDNVQVYPVFTGNRQLHVRIGGSGPDRASSGAYGIKINITDGLFANITNYGYAIFRFDYTWDDEHHGGQFESYADDAVWIKARITNTTGGVHYLGEHLDNLTSGNDPTPEIDYRYDPDYTMSGSAYIDLSSYITEPGMYYLDFGGKLYRTYTDEEGDFYFDNIQLRIANVVNNYYFKKNFTINDMDKAQRLFAHILADDNVELYVNGNRILDAYEDTDGEYWDHNVVSVNRSFYHLGQNHVAVKLRNVLDDAKFDLELKGANSNREPYMLVMTDGQANADCFGTGDARADAIRAACEASEDWGIRSFAVGYSTSADEATLQGIADCGGGAYAKSDNATELESFYGQVAGEVTSASRESQSVVVSGGGYADSVLYPDSYVEYEYTPLVSQPETNEILLTFETPKFQNCTPSVDIPEGIRIIDSKIVSYSGQHWTDYVGVNGVEVFNLSIYNNETYISLGDPFAVQIPPNVLVPGSLNNITLKTGDEPTINTNCSNNNSLQYVGLVNASTGRTGVISGHEGCNWTIESEDGNNVSIMVPEDYLDSRQCNYTNATFRLNHYSPESTYDVAVFKLLQGLDFDTDGRTLINLEQENLEIKVLLVTGLPYQWGPSLLEARLWQ